MTAHYVVLDGDDQYQFIDMKTLKVAKTVQKIKKGSQSTKLIVD